MSTAYSWQDDPLLDTNRNLAERRTRSTQPPWLKSAPFDISLLVASAVIVPLVLLAVWLGASSDAINIGVTAVVGGPHVFATFTATFADANFRRRHPFLIASSLLIPAAIVWLTIHDFQVLMSVFIVAASLHVVHQCAYLTDCYRVKAALRERRWARLVDYGFLFTSIYPIAIYKIVHGQFYLGDVRIIIPPILMHEASIYLEWALFAGFLGRGSTRRRTKCARGRSMCPKRYSLQSLRCSRSRSRAWRGQTRLELAFQSMNAWHSFQYLGLVWLINTMRLERGSSPTNSSRASRVSEGPNGSTRGMAASPCCSWCSSRRSSHGTR